MGLIEVEDVWRAYLFPGALRDVLRDGVDLIMHLDASSLPSSNAHQEHPEVCAAKIQCQEVSALCRASTMDSESVKSISLDEIHTTINFFNSSLTTISVFLLTSSKNCNSCQFNLVCSLNNAIIWQ